MTIRVLVVDDSGFFRRRLSEILNADPLLDVVGMAVDGKDAIEKSASLKPDVITMDIEMPVMNGIDATRQITQSQHIPVLMFSSLTHEGAKATLDALDAGAMDFLPKRFDEISNDNVQARQILCSRIKAIAKRPRDSRLTSAAPSSFNNNRTPAQTQSSRVTATPSALNSATSPKVEATRTDKHRTKFNPAEFDVVAIGTSTGGPVALQEVLIQLPATFSLPIVMVQHMPATFTTAFAARLNQQCKIEVVEAKNGDLLKAGTAYLAPGGKQMLVEKRGNQLVLKIQEDNDAQQNYKPCVNVTFKSLATAVGKRVQAIILTGMGADGREACQSLKQLQASLWAQDEATSTIYGMPAAVAAIADQVLPVKEIGKKLAMNS